MAKGAISASDAGQLRSAAHTLKGSASIFGAQPVVDAALRLETMSRNGDLVDATEAVASLESQLTRLLDVFRANDVTKTPATSDSAVP